jgi:hypothetical protein
MIPLLIRRGIFHSFFTFFRMPGQTGFVREKPILTFCRPLSGSTLPFTDDFEVYGEKAKDPENAEVDIFIALS